MDSLSKKLASNDKTLEAINIRMESFLMLSRISLALIRC